MIASDPRHARYQELQQSLCVALNMHVHFDSAHLLLDAVAWDAVDRSAAADDIRREMELLIKGGNDD